MYLPFLFMVDFGITRYITKRPLAASDFEYKIPNKNAYFGFKFTMDNKRIQY